MSNDSCVQPNDSVILDSEHPFSFREDETHIAENRSEDRNSLVIVFVKVGKEPMIRIHSIRANASGRFSKNTKVFQNDFLVSDFLLNRKNSFGNDMKQNGENSLFSENSSNALNEGIANDSGRIQKIQK